MYFPMDLKHNPTGKQDIDVERERREEIMDELAMMSSAGDADGETFTAKPSEEFEALLPYYNQVEAEALSVAKRYFHGDFVADSKNVNKQKLFEYEHNGHVYRCYVDIYNENDEEINIIEVKATTSTKFKEMVFSDGEDDSEKHPLFIKDGDVYHLNIADREISEQAQKAFDNKKAVLLNRYTNEGKYPHDLAFQKFVIEHALHKAGDNRRVNFVLAVLNSDYIYDGAKNDNGNRIYNNVDGQDLITFFDMNDIAEEYQQFILKEIATLESYISKPHDINKLTPVGKWCEWGKNMECIFCKHCFTKLRSVPDHNKANNYLTFHGFKEGNIKDKYQLINERYYNFDDVPLEWLEKENHKIQRECFDNKEEHIDKEKMQYWLDNIEFPIYHFDFESFPCPLPRFRGEEPYRQSVFEFSLHIERQPGVCDKEKDNIIFLNAECDDDEREALAKAIVDNFEFNDDGTLHGTMLAQNTSFERGRLKELAKLFPQYSKKLMAICEKSADLIHLLKTNEEMYHDAFPKRAKNINYYHPDLSGSYSIKKTLPVLVPSLTYESMDVGNGTQAYITYLNYDSPSPTFGKMNTKEERRAALSRYCQQDTWAMVEILRAVREKIK